MAHKLKGIVLHHIKYKDHSLIAYLYTNQFGRKTVIVKGKSNGNKKGGKLQVLSLLDFETQGRRGADMPSIKEYSYAELLPSILTDVRKSAIALFMGELLYKLLKEEEANEPLFNYLYHSICLLDALDEGVTNFHLHFMVQLARYLGFSMPDNRHGNIYFDIKSGEFTSIEPRHPQYFDQEETRVLTELLSRPASQLGQLGLHGELRYQFSCKMIDFYAFHFDHVLPVRSLSVLHELFSA